MINEYIIYSYRVVGADDILLWMNDVTLGYVPV